MLSYSQGLLDHLIDAPEDSQPVSDDEEDPAKSKVFYLKMKGDYWRYLAEVAGPEDRNGELLSFLVRRSFLLPLLVQ